MNPQYNNNESQHDPLNDVEFESGTEDPQQFNQGSTSIQDGVFEEDVEGQDD